MSSRLISHRVLQITALSVVRVLVLLIVYRTAPSLVAVLVYNSVNASLIRRS